MNWDEDDLEELEALRDDAWPESFGPPLVLVCRCHCVEEWEVEARVSQGCGLDEIALRTGATTGCGSCSGQIEAMVGRARSAG
jgi:bacterioferritin-associated ferredoxin